MSVSFIRRKPFSALFFFCIYVSVNHINPASAQTSRTSRLFVANTNSLYDMTFRIALIPDDTIYVLVVRPNYFQRRIASQETSSSYSFSHCTYVLHDPMLFLSLACTALRPFHFYFLCFFWSESADREASAMVHRPSSAFSFVHG